MLTTVTRTIREYNMIVPGDLVLVGVSGGPDSIALLHCLSQLSKSLEFGIHVIHINHGLRPEAEEEAQFVKGFAASLGIDTSISRLDGEALKRGSLQELAREARRRIFLDESKRLGATKLALGHNANDQAETVLQRLLRGGGTTGLSGIYPVREKTIRPLIFIRRSEIESYLQDNKLDYRIDKSNLKTVYLRNRIRIELLPQLEKEYNPRLVDTLSKTALILQEDNKYLEALAQEKLEQGSRTIESGILMPLAQFDLPEPVIKRMIRLAFSRMSGDPRGLEFEHVNKVLSLAKTGQSGSHLELPSGIRVYREQEAVLFSPHDLKVPNIKLRTIDVPGETLIEELGLVIRARVVDNPGYFPLPEGNWSLLLDYEQIKTPLYVRGRAPGDRILLRGHYRKLKEFYNEQKVPVRLRETSPVILAQNEVLWVPGILRGDTNKVTPKTAKLLELVVTKY